MQALMQIYMSKVKEGVAQFVNLAQQTMVVQSLKRPGSGYRPAVRVTSALCALGVMFLYGMSRSAAPMDGGAAVGDQHSSDMTQPSSRLDLKPVLGRHMLSYSPSEEFLGDDDVGDDDSTNCSSPRDYHKDYNDSCAYVRAECGDQAQLFDYLGLVMCDLSHAQWIGYIFLAVWLLYLISLLATTADNFFVPPLNLLSEKLHLSPSIAGITLLAIGNGAPDVFTAYAGLKQDDIQLVLGALIGASIFISTVVLGTIILVVEIKSDDIDRIDFVRDVTAYMLVVALVIGVAYDGNVQLFEAVLFLLFYLAYITIAVVLSYVRTLHSRMKSRRKDASEKDPLLDIQITRPQEVTVTIKEEVTAVVSGEEPEAALQRLELLGLTWPRGASIAVKIQFVVEWPMSLLRWISVPPCYYDGQWTKWHFLFAVISPLPMATLLLVASSGWTGFYDIWLGKLPLYPFLVMCCVPLSVGLFFLLSRTNPPHWSFQIVLGTLAFVMSIAWLNIEANEVVAVLDAFGLLFDIDTGILGLTVLAIGNSVGDWVADTAVARAGKPGMGIASCFGSPLLNDVLGLSIALMVRIGVYDHGKAYTFDIHQPAFLKVKMSWIFLGISLISSIIVIPLFKFSPPKPFGAALIYLYLVFMVFSILNETGHLNIDFLQ